MLAGIPCNGCHNFGNATIIWVIFPCKSWDSSYLKILFNRKPYIHLLMTPQYRVRQKNIYTAHWGISPPEVPQMIYVETGNWKHYQEEQSRSVDMMFQFGIFWSTFAKFVRLWWAQSLKISRKVSRELGLKILGFPPSKIVNLAKSACSLTPNFMDSSL